MQQKEYEYINEPRRVHWPLTIVIISTFILLLLIIPITYFFVISPNVKFEVEKCQPYPVHADSSLNYKKAKATLFGLDVSHTIRESGEKVDSHQIGEYRVRFTSWLTTKDCWSSIIIEDWDKPVISLDGPTELELEDIESYQEPGFSVSDNYDSDESLTSKVVITTKKVDDLTYNLLYDVSDSSNNEAETVCRTIHIVH